ncbi:glycosyltransferase [Verrucomicrobiaceae bacterium N1E253]|uniref:Glycosyltransferase n=1 Tax=Oceaniferula marina TaxID=2748318 RepID=A0A851GKG8_9BACT|nr:glycosyltransferase family 4 protein [Oceaniferula marina]NWK56341.1 glycosyltransferase [Oceaniferula marina]
MIKEPRIRNIAWIGGHVPRQCGIATFTTDLRRALATEYPEAACQVVAMTDPGQSHAYPNCVMYEIDQEDEAAYAQAADFLNLRGVEVLSVQHEFGIFGGDCGVYLLELLERVTMPVVATLHTILREPNEQQRRVMMGLHRLCDRFVVMADHGREMLAEVYGVPEQKVDVVHHGVIDVPFLDPEYNKERFGVLGNTVLLTFGLLSPNKGLECAIRALPGIIRENPEVVYVIAGVTHPHLRAHEGEAYRGMLQKLAEDLGVAEHVKFENRFMDLDELTAMIEAADIYVTPYLNEAQITSGALSYAFGAGKAVVSTPYWHAQELLSDERGILVPFSDHEAITEAVNRYLGDPCLMTAVRKRAYEMGRTMTWPHAARNYMASFERARAQRSGRVVNRVPVQRDLPPLNFQHMVEMTSHLGMFQHAVHNVPNNAEGCCSDDNARAYILTVLAGQLECDGKGKDAFCSLAGTYLAFLWDAFEPRTRKFRNFMSRGLEWMELEGSDDSHARAMWAVGVGVAWTGDLGHREVCAMLFHRGLAQLAKVTSPRAWAFGLLAINAYLESCPGDREVLRMRQLLVDRLLDLYQHHTGDTWAWFESVVAYDNARLSQALIQSGQRMGSERCLQVGLDSLRWLVEVQTAEGGWFSPVGCYGFWQKGGERAQFDQQPLEASAMVSACLQAEAATGDPFWQAQADFCLAWFTGHNDLGLKLYDETTGGCHDALQADRLNSNQGAESTIVFHLALVELMLARQQRQKGNRHAPPPYTSDGHRVVT